MLQFLLKSYIRSCLVGRVSNLVIASLSLQLKDANYVRCYVYTRFSTFSPSQTSQFENLTSSSELQIVVNKIHVGCSEDEIVISLINDEACEAISVSHTLVYMLLCQFQDDWKSALGVFRWAQSRPYFEHWPEAYDSMIDILGKAKQFDKMSELVQEMTEKNLVSLRTMVKVMRRFAGARRWKDVVRTFDELGTFGLEKNVESMNFLLDTLCREKQVEMARAIFMELKSHIKPTVHSFTIFINGWCKIKRVEEAYWTLEEMKGHGFSPCVISYSTIIQSYCRLSNWEKAYELLEMMESRGCQPNVITYTTMMSSLSKANKLEEALQIAERVKSARCKADTRFYNALINTLGKAQRIWDAYNVFKVEMPKSGIDPNTCTYNTLIAMFCHHGQDEMAFNILECMETASCKPDLVTFNPLLKACFKLGNPDCHLSKLMDDMAMKHHLSLDVSTYSLLIHGLCRVNKGEWAFRLFEEMISKELTPNRETCFKLLEVVKQNNMYDAAERVVLHTRNLKEQQKFPGFKKKHCYIEE
ncbi:pentatricopeptide repeat-containing protein At3g04130, mitochondrial [Amaranthus tricolor]|uniref:pentatricopeptide repeat-containing protein At3g04130, mitochondrial n=1 Tax=Amaranthus tricolor TaxID=29722 RepID=UPI002584248A|nr:pentatricopeptide repeat-containing protein At3g04130, mitochondrial [Amaranthus tricolor]